MVRQLRGSVKISADSLTPRQIPFAVVSTVSALLESMENIFELDAVLEIDSFLMSFFLPAKTLLGPKVIG